MPQHRERLYLAAFRDAAAAAAFRWPSLPAARGAAHRALGSGTVGVGYHGTPPDTLPPQYRTLGELLEPLADEERSRYELSETQWRQVRVL